MQASTFKPLTVMWHRVHCRFHANWSSAHKGIHLNPAQTTRLCVSFCCHLAVLFLQILSFLLHTTTRRSWSVDGGTPDSGRFYFGGDTGYRSVPAGVPREDEHLLPHCPAFAEIGERLGPFDLGLIPIGAYEPRHVMSPVHLSPEDAVCVHRDVRSRHSIGMHWGTFVLTTEPVDEPPRRLKEAAEAAGLAEDEFVVIAIGETVDVPVAAK
jgi:N-acyl-phosphatidylethanolamine-hydrolysing phospholipase D